MPAAGIGLFFIDFVARPFAKIFEKMPLLMLAILLIVYGTIAYVVLKSAWQTEKKYY